MDDGPSHSIQAITLDTFFGHLLFAKEVDMTREQAEEFVKIVKKLEDAVVAAADSDKEKCFMEFRTALLNNSTLNLAPRQPTPVVVGKQ